MGKIPEHAKKVFEGVIFDTYQFEQELYDGSMTTFEVLDRPNTLQCIPIVGDKILLIKDSQPHRPTLYTFPGGRQEPGESFVEGAVREMLEETGHVSEDVVPFRVYTPSHKINWDIHMFIAYDAKPVRDQAVDTGEQVTMHLVTFDELIDIVLGEEFMEKEFALDVARMAYNNELDTLKQSLFKQT